MKRNILVFGLIAGIIVSAIMAVTIGSSSEHRDYNESMMIGYLSMIVAFSFVFVGIKNYRDKYNGGLISFGAAFKLGFFISLIASTLYVITWMIMYHFFIPDFMDKYADHMIKEAQQAGASAAEIQAKTEEMAGYKEMYKNPLMIVLFTYVEILPVGLIITLISSLILKRNYAKSNTEAMG